jgi:FkbM family methyltransferase
MTDISKTYIKELIGSGASILEVGSFDGKDAFELAEVCETVVDAFEPNPASFLLITEKIKSAQNYAVTGHDGYISLNISNHPQSDSLKEPRLHKKIWPEIKFTEKIKVKCLTLDSWNHRVRDAKPVDFCWVDINGAEDAFLIGAAATLNITKYLYIEYCAVELFQKALDKDGMIKALPGFEVIGEFNAGPSYGNLLFKNKNEALWEPIGQ